MQQEDTISVEQFLKEASLMKDMKHPHLVQLFGVCTRRIPFFIITEFMEKGNLLYFIQGPEGADLQPVTLMHMGKQIADGMAYLEKLNIIHRLVLLYFLYTHIITKAKPWKQCETLMLLSSEPVLAYLCTTQVLESVQANLLGQD